MFARHVNELDLRLDRACDVGCAEITHAELKRWFDKERITKTVWQKILEKWKELEPGVPLLVGESDMTYVLVYGAGLTVTDKGDGWLEDMEKWAA